MSSVLSGPLMGLPCPIQQLGNTWSRAYHTFNFQWGRAPSCWKWMCGCNCWICGTTQFSSMSMLTVPFMAFSTKKGTMISFKPHHTSSLGLSCIPSRSEGFLTLSSECCLQFCQTHEKLLHLRTTQLKECGITVDVSEHVCYKGFFQTCHLISVLVGFECYMRIISISYGRMLCIVLCDVCCCHNECTMAQHSLSTQ